MCDVIGLRALCGGECKHQGLSALVFCFGFFAATGTITTTAADVGLCKHCGLLRADERPVVVESPANGSNLPLPSSSSSSPDEVL